ncbi:MAG: hypothetical protein D6767_00355, partial [Candidatus Hydrogenedentota bacterium]
MKIRIKLIVMIFVLSGLLASCRDGNPFKEKVPSISKAKVICVGCAGKVTISYVPNATALTATLTRSAMQGLPKEYSREDGMQLMEMTLDPLIDNALTAVKTGIFSGTAEQNMQKLLTMSPSTANLDGTNMADLLAMADLFNLGGGKQEILAQIMNVGFFDPFLPQSIIKDVMLDDVLRIHPKIRYDGVLPIYLSDALSDMGTLIRLAQSDKNMDGIDDDSLETITYEANDKYTWDAVNKKFVDADSDGKPDETPDCIDDFMGICLDADHDCTNGTTSCYVTGDTIPVSFLQAANYSYNGIMTQAPYSKVMKDSFVMQMPAQVNATARQGWDFSLGKRANRDSLTANQITLMVTPDKDTLTPGVGLSMSGLENNPRVDMTFRMDEWVVYPKFNGVEDRNTQACTQVSGGSWIPWDSGTQTGCTADSFFDVETDQYNKTSKVKSVFFVGSTVYLATEGGLIYSSNLQYPFNYISTNNNVLPTNDIRDVVVNGSNIYLATDQGVLVSTDGGTTFTQKTTTDGLGSNDVRSLTIVPGASDTIYAATAAGLSISTDSAATFTNYTTSNGLVDNSINYAVASGGNLYIATDAGLNICTTSVTGCTVKTLANGLGANKVYEVILFSIGATNYIAVGTDGGLSISTDNGTSFSNMNTTNGLLSNRILSLAYDSTNQRLIAGTDAALSVSQYNAGSFGTFSNFGTGEGLGAALVYKVRVTGGVIYAATDGGISVENGSTYNNTPFT